MRALRRIHLLTLLALALTSLAAFGCGGGSSSDGGSVIDSGWARFQGPTSMGSDSGTVQLDPQPTGFEGDPIRYTWRVVGGPGPVHFSDPSSTGEVTATFPVVGSYPVEVVGSDPKGTTAELRIMVTIRPAAGRDLELNVADRIAANDVPLRSLPVALYWSPDDEEPLQVVESDIEGWLTFSGLTDELGAYRILIPTN